MTNTYAARKASFLDGERLRHLTSSLIKRHLESAWRFIQDHEAGNTTR